MARVLRMVWASSSQEQQNPATGNGARVSCVTSGSTGHCTVANWHLGRRCCSRDAALRSRAMRDNGARARAGRLRYWRGMPPLGGSRQRAAPVPNSEQMSRSAIVYNRLGYSALTRGARARVPVAEYYLGRATSFCEVVFSGTE